MGFLVTSGHPVFKIAFLMHHSFVQKIVMVIVAGALAAGLFEFYRVMIDGADQALNGKYSPAGQHSTPRPTPRRF